MLGALKLKLKPRRKSSKSVKSSKSAKPKTRKSLKSKSLKKRSSRKPAAGGAVAKKPKSDYKRTSRKVVIGNKKCTVYLRRKDGAECVRRRSKSGKTTYRKLSKVMAKRGGCGCASTPQSYKGGFSAPAAPAPPVAKEILGYNAAALLEGEVASPSPALDGGAKRLDKNKKDELYRKARKYGIKGRSKMTKKQLVAAVRAAHKAVGERLRRRKSGSGRRSSAK